MLRAAAGVPARYRHRSNFHDRCAGRNLIDRKSRVAAMSSDAAAKTDDG
jgi:hypothetical protein